MMGLFLNEFNCFFNVLFRPKRINLNMIGYDAFVEQLPELVH